MHIFRDVAYPAQLREIYQVPPVLFTRGTLRPGEPAVSVVGSRRASDHSLDWASEVSVALVSAGITVVSGLAAGVDTAAHTAALDAGGRTVAVLGTGINRVYPALQRRPGVHVVSGVDEALGVIAALRPDLDDVLSGVLAVDG